MTKFAHTSIDTAAFKAFLYEFFAAKRATLDEVDWEAWFFAPGMPPVTNVFDNSLARDCEELAQR